ncbi:catalase [Paenibacillus sp. PR3]|uniref:catalase n=1 Tax=Paenibacillus terricola TaxID=2763503 RepID=A0ABR8MXH1_9BACL|nr:catalase [Paenibacillus terricola]MBD3920657.1 catalase [Paenibacillus terricola]
MSERLIANYAPSAGSQRVQRVMHARGAGARGIFVTEHSMAAYTKAHFLQTAGQETPVLVRFSTVFHGKGSPEAVRDPRCYAVKLLTQEGQHDIVGSHIPVSFVREAAKFKELEQAMRPSPDTNEQSPAQYWEQLSHLPESTHMLTWLFANDGTPASYRQMNGYSAEPLKWVNAEGTEVYVRYAWKSKQGVVCFTPDEMAAVQASDYSHATRDLYAAIENGEHPQWELHVQLMAPEAAATLSFDPMDPTKIWPENLFPFIRVGTMTLHQNPINYFGEVEKAVFSNDALVPGIEAAEETFLTEQGIDDFAQAGERVRALPDCERDWLVRNLINDLQQASQETQHRAAGSFYRADAQLGMQIAAALGIDLDERMPRS